MFEWLKKIIERPIYWYCDNCGACMNDQYGFTTSIGVHRCTICGFDNDVTSKNIGCGNKIKPPIEKDWANIKVQFNNVISKELFEYIAICFAKTIKRLSVEVNNSVICGTVQTISGLQSWKFVVDFNYFGSVTGKYVFIKIDNPDSNIPEIYAEKIKTAIKSLYSKSNLDPENLEKNHCPNCGELLDKQEGFSNKCVFWRCKRCGTLSKLKPHDTQDRYH